MMEQSYLESDIANVLQSRSVKLAAKPSWSSAKYPAYLDIVKRHLRRDYEQEDLRTEGLRIFTTLDPQIQDIVEKRAIRKLAALEKSKSLERGSLELAVVITDISSGAVLAVLGGRDSSTVSFNRAIDAYRPVGSLIKPMVYYTALSDPDKFNVLSVLDDTSLSIKQADGTVWQPNNYDRISHGQVSLLESIVNSYNIATVRLGLSVGIDNIISTIKKAGIDSKMKPYASLSLGAVDLSPLEVTQMYQTLANGGFLVPLNTIRSVLDSRGNALRRYGLEIHETLKPETVFLTNYLMTQVVEKGTAKSLVTLLPNKLPLAGKTGTTNEQRDSWFAGFGNNLLGVVWLGRDDNEPASFTGASGAMRIWADIMKSIQLEPIQAIAPETVSWAVSENVQYEGSCISIDKIPYIGEQPLVNSSNCEQKPQFKKKSFNPFGVFQR